MCWGWRVGAPPRGPWLGSVEMHCTGVQRGPERGEAEHGALQLHIVGGQPVWGGRGARHGWGEASSGNRDGLVLLRDAGLQRVRVLPALDRAQDRGRAIHHRGRHAGAVGAREGEAGGGGAALHPEEGHHCRVGVGRVGGRVLGRTALDVDGHAAEEAARVAKEAHGDELVHVGHKHGPRCGSFGKRGGGARKGERYQPTLLAAAPAPPSAAARTRRLLMQAAAREMPSDRAFRGRQHRARRRRR